MQLLRKVMEILRFMVIAPTLRHEKSREEKNAAGRAKSVPAGMLLSIVPAHDEPCLQCNYPCNVIFPFYSASCPRLFCKSCGWHEVRPGDKYTTKERPHAQGSY